MGTRDVQELLYEGERVEDRVDFGSSRVIVTGRRVLAFTPTVPGKNYRAVDRPNVDNVAVRTRSESGHLRRTGELLVGGAILAGVGVFVDTDGLFAVDASEGANALGLSGTIGTLQGAIGMIDDAMLYGGLLVAAVSLVFVGLYLRSRETVVSIDVAGDADVDLPLAEVGDPQSAVENLRLALGISLERGDSEGGRDWDVA